MIAIFDDPFEKIVIAPLFFRSECDIIKNRVQVSAPDQDLLKEDSMKNASFFIILVSYSEHMDFLKFDLLIDRKIIEGDNGGNDR